MYFGSQKLLYPVPLPRACASAVARIPARHSQTMLSIPIFPLTHYFSLSEAEMSAQGAVPPVLCQEVWLALWGRGGEPLPALLLPPQPQVPQAPPGQGRGARQGVQRPGGPHLLGILRLAPGHQELSSLQLVL